MTKENKGYTKMLPDVFALAFVFIFFHFLYLASTTVLPEAFSAPHKNV